MASGTLTYSGSDQTISGSAGSCTTGGTMYYYTSNYTSSTAPTFSTASNGGWSTTFPTAKGNSARTYYLWYYCYVSDTANNKAKSGSTINAAQSITKAIGKYTPTLAISATTGSVNYNATNSFTSTPTTISSCVGTLTATSASASYVTVANSSSGTYAVSASHSSAASGTAKTFYYKGVAYTTGNNITVSYTPSDTSNCNSASTKTIAISVARISQTVTFSNVTKTYNGSAQPATGATTSGDGTISYKYYSNSTCTSGETTTAPTNAGTYYVKAFASQTSHYNSAESACRTYTMNQREVTVTAPTMASGTLTYSGSDQTITGSAGSCTAGGTMYYYTTNYTTTSAPTFSTSTWSTTFPSSAKGNSARTYYLWYYCYVSDTTNNKAASGSSINTALEVTKVINQLKCATPTSVAISTAGYVSWTNSATSACTTHQVKVASGSYSTATSPVDKNSDITASTGSRSVSVIAKAPNANYLDSDAVSASVTVYTITFASNDTNKGTVSPTSKNVISGATVTTSGNNLLIKGVTTGSTTTTLATVTPTPMTGYSFSSWSQTSGSLTSAQTITATFEGNIYGITLDRQSGSGGTSTVYYRYKSSRIVDGTTCYYYTDSDLSDESCLPNGYTITAPTKSGKTFAGYYSGTYGSGTQYITSGSNFTNNIYLKMPSEINSSYTDTITLYAKWTYTVTYHENNTCSGTVSNLPSSQTAVENVNTTLSTTQPTCSGDEVFIGWFADNVWYDPGATYTAKNNITLYARWYNIKALEQQYTSFVEYGDFETDTVSKGNYNAGGAGSTYVWTQAAETMSGYTNKGLSGFSYTDLYRPYWVVEGQGQVRQQEAGSGDLIQFYLYTKNRTSTSYSDSIQSRINRLKRLQDVTLTYDELKSKECVEDNKTLNGTYYQGTCEPDSTYQIIGYSGFNVTAATTNGTYYSRAYMGKIHKLTDSSYGFFQVGLAQNVTAKLKITVQYLEQKMKSASSSYSDPTTPAIGTSSKGYARGTALASLESGAENRFPASYLKVSSRLSGSSYTVSAWASATSSVNISVSSANKCKILGIAGHAANNDTGGSNMSYAVINRAQIGTINAAGTTSNVRYYGGNASRSTSTGQTLTKVLGFTHVRYLCQGSISTS